jgi:hypothetical protein
MLHTVWHYFEPGIMLAILIVAMTSGGAEHAGQGWFAHLARRRRLAVGVVTVLALAGAVLLTLGRGMPAPAIHDEFAYLLHGDTFAHGRLTNPPHPLAVFFDTFHVLQRPTYSAKYPPAQGLFLALGQILWHPVVGVWISFALFCGALCWMLQAWLPPRWALIGAFLMMVRLLAAYGTQQWAYGYWGGSVAALGGALLFGAGRRLWNQPMWSQASLLGVGLAILANSRPLEGLVASIVMLGALAWRYTIASPFKIPASWLNFVAGTATVLLPTMIGMGYYNHQVTGNWRTLPYRVHLEQYTQVPIFLWQKGIAVEPTYTSRTQREFHSTYEKSDWDLSRTACGLASLIAERIAAPVRYYVGWLLLVPFVIGISSLRPWSLFTTLSIGALWLVGLQTSWFLPHYTAPVVCLFTYQIATGLRRLSHWRFRDRYVGHTLVQLTMLAYLALAVATVVPPGVKSVGWQHDRVRLEEQLIQSGGKHLVIVHYEPTHIYHQEWVYNSAEIDRSPLVWAREHTSVDSLLNYYHDRTVWRLYADEKPPRLEQVRGPVEATSGGAKSDHEH